MSSDPVAAPHPVAPWRATLALVVLLGVGLAVLFGVQKATRRVSTDMLELLPRDELDPTIKLARQTASGRLGKTLLFALSDRVHPDRPPTDAAALVAGELGRSPLFNGVFTGMKADDKDRLQAWFFERRLPLRLPVWLDGMAARWQKEKGPGSPAEPDPAWLANAAATDLQEFQNTSDALAYQERLPSDPLLLIPALLSVFGDEDKTTASDVAGGALVATGPDKVRYALIQAEIKDSPLTDAGQRPVFAVIERALESARAKFGANLTLQYTGANKLAAELTERSKREVGLLTNLSLVLSCVLLFIAFRRITIFAYLLLPILTAVVWSMVACFALFERVHSVTIIFTTVLIGVALDYGIYAFSHARQSAGGGMAQALREIRLPLIAGCLTSVGGFIFMTLTNLPMLQQMGVAVALGLLFALGLDFLYLPFIPALPSAAVGATSGRKLSLGGAGFPVLALVALLTAGSLVAAAHVRWNDDVSTLAAVSPALQDEQTFLRGLFGQSKSQHIVLTSGRNLDAAFANVATLNAKLMAASTAPADRFVNLGKLLPTAEQAARCQAYFRAHPDFARTLQAALSKDFNADAFAPFWEDWTRWLQTNDDPSRPPPTPAQLIVGLRSVLPLPLQNLWNEEQAGAAWLATRISDSLYQKLPPGTLAAPNAPVDQVATLNGALKRYRVAALARGGIGLGIIAVMVTLVYGWRRALFMLVIPAVSILLAVAILGFLRQPLGLLHVVALLLGFCLASDYSIFLGSPGELPHSTRRAVLLAASTASSQAAGARHRLQQRQRGALRHELARRDHVTRHIDARRRGGLHLHGQPWVLQFGGVEAAQLGGDLVRRAPGRLDGLRECGTRPAVRPYGHVFVQLRRGVEPHAEHVAHLHQIGRG